MKKAVKRALSGQRVPQRRIVVLVGALASLAILAYLAMGHLEKILRVGGAVQWRWVWLAVVAALGSYMMIGLALRVLLQALGHTLTLAESLGIALVSTTANYFVSSAGVSGFALKAHLLRKRHIPYATTVTASVLSSAILYMVLGVIIAQGLVYLALRLGGTRIALMESIFGLLLLLAIAVPLIIVFFNQRLRNRLTRAVFHWLNRATFLFSRSEIPREEFQAFEDQLNSGLERVRGDKARLTVTVLFTCLDWGLSMLSLWLAFRALGIHLPVGHLSAGFTAGMAATLIPLLPGGLGVVEGSMAAVFEGLGILWEKAFVGVLLFRLSYYLVPGLMSVLVLWGLKVSEPALIERSVAESREGDGKRHS